MCLIELSCLTDKLVHFFAESASFLRLKCYIMNVAFTISLCSVMAFEWGISIVGIVFVMKMDWLFSCFSFYFGFYKIFVKIGGRQTRPSRTVLFVSSWCYYWICWYATSHKRLFDIAWILDCMDRSSIFKIRMCKQAFVLKLFWCSHGIRRIYVFFWGDWKIFKHKFQIKIHFQVESFSSGNFLLKKVTFIFRLLDMCVSNMWAYLFLYILSKCSFVSHSWFPAI